MSSRHHARQEQEPELSALGRGERFEAVMQRRVSRRGMLRGGAAAAAVVVAGGEGMVERPEVAAATLSALGFSPLPPSTEDALLVADNHVADVLLRWGDPLVADAPDFDPHDQSASAQARQFGYNCDYIGLLPFADQPDRGLLCVNHEYTSSEPMFPDYDPEQPTAEQTAIEKAATGMSIVEVRRADDGRWTVVRDSEYNRRITADTPIELTGPVAGDEAVRTHRDPEGRTVLGTVNNCAGGITPWGTVLTAEENFHKYFAHADQLPDDDPRRQRHARYGLKGRSDWGWERTDTRFDTSQEPHEPNRFGWVVEVDPFDPGSTPMKRTALGRFRHEGAATTIAPSGHVVVYSADDAAYEYAYKFVSAREHRPSESAHNRALLDDGTLYVARFDDDGSGQWLPLVHGVGPLTGSNSFTSQADVLVRTREAADLLGATKMDRPEDMEANPVTGRVYLAMTNNPLRGAEGQPATDAANPRKANAAGHVIEIMENDNDHAATQFRWEIFLLCGDPADQSTYYAGFPKDQVSAIAAPDNVTFDLDGNLWIATDGQPSALEINDSLYAVPVAGPERGAARRFLSTVVGAEVCGPEFTADNTSLFVSVQHPGEGGTFEQPASRWPDGSGPPRPSVIAVRHAEGARVGSGPAVGAVDQIAPPEAPRETGGPWTGVYAAVASLGAGAAATLALLRWRAGRLGGRKGRPEVDEGADEADEAGGDNTEEAEGASGPGQRDGAPPKAR